MIEIAIDPILYRGAMEIRWSTLFFIFAILIIIATGIMGIKRIGINIKPGEMVWISLLLIIGAIIGSRLFYTIDNWEFYTKHPENIISLEGMVIYGAILGALAGIALYLWLKRRPYWRYGDGIAPGAMLGMTLYRIGCVINGCCYGLPATLPWAVVYTHPDTEAPFGKLLHPTQIYHLILSLIAFAVLWTLRHRLKTEGSLFLLWLILFAITDLPVRFFRVEAPFFFDLKLAVIVDIIILIITIPWFILQIRSTHNREPVTSSHS